MKDDLSGAMMVRVEAPEQQTLILLVEHELVIGRESEGLRIADPQMSRRHLRIRRLGSSIEVSDLGSTNGSFLDGVPLKQPQVVNDTCRVLIGDTTITIDPAAGADEATGLGRDTQVRRDDDLRSTSIDIVAGVVTSSVLDVEPDSLDGETVTILFSDIESSTERATAMGDAAWFELLEAHNAIIRTELARFGGREVKSIGDGFMLVFPSVRRSLRFATEVQKKVEAPNGPDLRIRMGIHTGETIIDAAGDLFGRHVNLAARVANLAEGGEIMASLVVREIAAGRDDAVFGEPSQAELKGFAELQTVYQVHWDQ